MSILTLPGNPLQDLPLLLPRKTIAELLQELGDIPAERVRLFPYPGTATEDDAIRINESERICELIDGTIVEKAVSLPADYLGTLVAHLLMTFVLPRKLGMVVSASGLFRMIHGNLREPDVSFTRKDRLPNPLPRVGGWCPDLCVEVLSPGNTKKEMIRKRSEYFTSGCQIVWEIDPEKRTAGVYTKSGAVSTVGIAGSLDGSEVLPGFQLSLAEVFAYLDSLNPGTE